MRSLLFAAGVAAPIFLPTPAAGAQTVLERTPNLSSGWVGEAGTAHFNFLHRFVSSSAPERKVTAVPTFLVAVGLPANTLAGVHWSSNSAVAPRYPNEWEGFVRWSPLREEGGAPATVSLHGAWNAAARSADGEVSIARRLGALRLVGAGRVFSNGYDDRSRTALAAGATLALGRWAALAADFGALTDRDDAERAAWGAALQLAIPYTPHSLSLQATNATTGTLEGASRGDDETRWGFEFTIPLTLSRYFGSRRGDEETSAAPAADTATVVVARIANMAFRPDVIEIVAGTTVEWRNDDELVHTVTADDDSFDSGLLATGKTWRRTFDTPGRYPFHCMPHPFMKGVVVVRER